jgi:hypothetical protein
VIVVGEYQGFFIFHTDAESIPYSVDACGKVLGFSAACVEKVSEIL